MYNEYFKKTYIFSLIIFSFFTIICYYSSNSGKFELIYLFPISIGVLIFFERKIAHLRIFQLKKTISQKAFSTINLLFLCLILSIILYESFFLGNNFMLKLIICDLLLFVGIVELSFIFIFNNFLYNTEIFHDEKMLSIFLYNFIKKLVYILLCLLLLFLIFKLPKDEQVDNIRNINYVEAQMEDWEYLLNEARSCKNIIKTKKGLLCLAIGAKLEEKYFVLPTSEISKLSEHNLFKDPEFTVLILKVHNFRKYSEIGLNNNLNSKYSIDDIKDSLNELDKFIKRNDFYFIINKD